MDLTTEINECFIKQISYIIQAQMLLPQKRVYLANKIFKFLVNVIYFNLEIYELKF